MRASFTLLSRRRYRSMMAVSKGTPLSRGIWSVTSPEGPVVVAAAVALTGLAALIAGGLCQGLRLLLQQLVQGFLHAAADQFPDLTLL